MSRTIISFILPVIMCLSALSQGVSDKNAVRIYSYPMEPRKHPDDIRRLVKPPDCNTFNNQVQFMALRSLDGDYKSLLDQYTIKFGLGNIIWPSYPIIFRNDLPDVVQELKRRNLYLFDIWGFVPGSGPGGYWQQFVMPANVPGLFEKELGDHWLGMDNGEQDGRYVGGYASQMTPSGNSRELQYLNFQNHFEGLTTRLGNKMATLVSLNFGHYFLKEGVYTMIGAETAQGLPNTQIYYSFIRGAGKQYGVPWFGNASVWNRWGWKNYTGITDYNGGEREGSSLSLLKRLIYSHIMYNCSAVGFEASFLNAKDELSPIGRIQQSAVRWVKQNGNPGIQYTPVAVMLDFLSGWSFPRHLYTDNLYRVWGNLPYEEGDYLTDNILDLIYPHYQDASFFHDESGFISPTPYGDAADCILSDCPLWLMQQYPVMIIGSNLQGGAELKDKLESYVESGGRLVITSGNLANFSEGISSVRAAREVITIPGGTEISIGAKNIHERTAFEIRKLTFPSEAKILAYSNDSPLAIELSSGKGTITVFASTFSLNSKPGKTADPGIDNKIETPFPMLSHVRQILGDILGSTEIFDCGEGLSQITCRKGKGDYTVAICNPSWNEKHFHIKTRLGQVLKIKELPIDCSERQAVGFLPKTVSLNPGRNTGNTIAGGDIRIFSVKMTEDSIEEIPPVIPVPNPVNRGLSTGSISSIKKEILLRPTFFQHYDRIVVDWKYLYEKESSAIAGEATWIKQQGLKVIVDLSSGLNLFPDMRLVNNDSTEYTGSMITIRSVIDKMALLGAGDLVLSAHRTIENNFSDEEFSASLRKTLKVICKDAALKNINVHLRLVTGKFADTPEKGNELCNSVGESNFYIAPSIGLLAADNDNLMKNIGMLKELRYTILFTGAPEKDLFGKLWNINKPLYKFKPTEDLMSVLRNSKDKIFLLEGLYADKDEEYLDIKNLEEVLK